MINRIIRALRMDPSLYRQIGQSEAGGEEPVLIVALVALLAASGVSIGAKMPLVAFFLELVNSVVFGWLIWTVVTSKMAGRYGNEPEMSTMSRVLAYATLPRLLLFFSFIPCFGWVFRVLAWVFSFTSGVVAVRESVRLQHREAMAAALPGLVLYIGASAAIALVFGGLPMVGL